MKKYGFRLESVRRVRRLQEDMAKAALAGANGEVKSAIAAVEARVAGYETRVSNFSAATVGVDAFMRSRWLDGLAGDALVIARQDQAAAEQRAAERREEWSAKAREVKALDRLDERRREEYRIEYERDLDAQTDDIVTGRFGRTGNGRRADNASTGSGSEGSR